MPDNSGALVMRYQWASYMKCGKGDTAAFALIGEGFTSFPESKNPKEYSRKYINYQTEKTDVIGYAPSIAYSCDVITGDPVVQEIVKITDAEAVGSDTHRDIVSVNLWESEVKYDLTSDNSIVAGKTYYTRSGSEGSYAYSAIDTPDASDISTYYEKSTLCKASKRTYAIVPDGKGEGTDAMIYTGTMKAVSDMVIGTFNIETKAFEEDN